MLTIIARAIANARSDRRVETARRIRGKPTAMSLAIARLDAKAVQEAMRTPTPAMTKAGATVAVSFGACGEEASRLVYQANIDAMETEGA